MNAKITGLTMKNCRPNKNGSTIVAFFNCHTDDIGFKGCALVRKADGEWAVWTPKLENRTVAERRADGISVYWRSGSRMETAVLDAAVAAYELFAGDEEA